MIAVILAGRHAELAREDGNLSPKILAPVAGKPLLEHQLSWLKEAGLNAAVLCAGVGAPVVRARFGDGSSFGVSLRYFVEDAPLGTAGALRALGAASLPENILVLPGDTRPVGDGRRFIAHHLAHDALATLAVHECGHPRDCDPVILGPGQAVMELPKRPLVGGYPMALSPLYLFRREFLRGVPESGAWDLVRDAYPAMLRRGRPLAGYLDNALVVDLALPGRPRAKARAR
ncbi:MAG: NTP transferase domain-containing protein [Elusimicrobia bacterium]|nr:NTP transferase domain-containing protein [Elusimicrobiota bacterium]